MSLCYSYRAHSFTYRHLDESNESARILINCTIPLNEIVTDFFDNLKSRSSGYASFE